MSLDTAMIPLPTGGSIPQFGIGTYKVPDEEAERVVSEALELGYRHIDTATMYGNEEGVGRAIAASGLPRDELFVTTKLNNPDHEPQAARDAIARSLDLLGLDFVDLYLIHWPMARTTDYRATWRTLVEFRQDGRARHIGVSNFEVEHLVAVIEDSGVTPEVNQVEVNPYLVQDQLRAFHAEHGILTEAWSPLARGNLLEDPVLVDLAGQLGCTVSQLVLAWHLHRGDIVFPKSMSRQRIQENAESLHVRLDDYQVAAITRLNRNERSGSAPGAVELGSKR